MPAANAEAMSLHLAAIGRKVAAGSHAALVLDGAGYHIAAALTIPENVTLVRLPPYAPDSIRSKTSRNICAATNSRSPSSLTTTTSLIKLATHGTSLNKFQRASRQSPREHGQQSINRAVGIIIRSETALNARSISANCSGFRLESASGSEEFDSRKPEKQIGQS
jgi:hypothetical protein